MKRKILFLVLAMISLSGFAYSDYYSHDSSSGWLVFLSIVFFCWGILEIILFFKVWKMTNDVASIAEDKSSTINKLPLKKFVKSIRKKFYTGQADEAFDDLNSYTYHHMSLLEVSSFGTINGKPYVYVPSEGFTLHYETPQEYLTDVIKMMAPLYEAIGREIPDYLKNLTYEDFRDFAKDAAPISGTKQAHPIPKDADKDDPLSF